MALFRIIEFFRAAHELAQLDPEVLDDAAKYVSWWHVRHHRRIVWMAGIIGVFFGVGGTIGLIYATINNGAPDGSIFVIIAAPFGFAIAGVVFGATFGCLISPREFLEGPLGLRWMSYFGGTKSVWQCRLMCGIIAVFIGAVLIFLSLVPMLIAHGILPSPRPKMPGE